MFETLQFATEYVSLPPGYWDDAIFSDKTKIILYDHDGPQRVWRKPLTALENKNLNPIVTFGKFSVMVWGCITYSCNYCYIELLHRSNENNKDFKCNYNTYLFLLIIAHVQMSRRSVGESCFIQIVPS